MKFFLDNNLPPSWAKALHALSEAEGHSVCHLRDKFPQDSPDVEWIGKLSEEAGWVILSGDIRITKSVHEREAWLQSKLIGFFMHKSWTNHPMWDRTWRIVRWWPNIIQQAELVKPPAGFVVPVNFGPGKFESIKLK